MYALRTIKYPFIIICHNSSYTIKKYSDNYYHIYTSVKYHIQVVKDLFVNNKYLNNLRHITSYQV